MKSKREKTYRYEKNIHLTWLDAKDRKYCRSANAIIPFDADRCFDCPLWNGEVREVACEYYDLEGVTSMVSTDAKKRASGLIEAGITPEYPDFLDEKAIENGGVIYEKALQFAAVAHKGTYRKGTKIPYIVHPVEVSSIVGRVLLEKVGRFTKNEYEIMAAAALHDVVEDTQYTIEDIGENFNDKIEKLVGYESEDKRLDMPAKDSWKIRKVEFLSHLHHAPEDAKLICLGDKLSNIRTLSKDYALMEDDCFQKFNVKIKDEHGWYYKCIKDELTCFSDTKAYDEFCSLIQQIFG